MEKPRPVGTQLEPGTLLNDRYYIVKRIGGGGMGSVYQARDKRLADRLCAVKEMIEMFADENQRALVRGAMWQAFYGDADDWRDGVVAQVTDAVRSTLAAA